MLEPLRDWLTFVIVLCGGVWALYRWFHSERLRRKKEMASLDGHLTKTIVPIGTGRTLVSLQGKWRNLSPLPVHVDSKQTCVDVYGVPTDVTFGTLVPEKDLGAVIYQHYFLEDITNYVLEPKSENTLQTYFILEPGIYIFRMKIYRDSKKDSGHESSWTRELVLDIRQ